MAIWAIIARWVTLNQRLRRSSAAKNSGLLLAFFVSFAQNACCVVVLTIASGWIIGTTIVQECDAHVIPGALTVLKSDHSGPFLWSKKALRLSKQVRGTFCHSLWQQNYFILIVENLFSAIHLGCDLLEVIWSIRYIIASLSMEKHISDGLIMAIERFRAPEPNMMALSFCHGIRHWLLRFSDLSFTLILHNGFSIFVLLGWRFSISSANLFLSWFSSLHFYLFQFDFYYFYDFSIN